MLINIDFDGVLIPNDYEKRLVLRGLDNGFTKISQLDGKTFDWYIEMVNTSVFAPINIPFLKQLNRLKEEGHFIRLWTNRPMDLKKHTVQTLGEWSRIFDSFEFYSGKKSQSRVEGIAIDNDSSNLHCAELGGIHYEWR